MTIEHFKVLISVVQVVLVPLLAAGLTYLNRIRTSVETTKFDLHAQIETARDELRKDLHEITAEVRQTNGRLSRLEEWRQGHDHTDDQRETRASKDIETVRNDIRQLQQAIIGKEARA